MRSVLAAALLMSLALPGASPNAVIGRVFAKGSHGQSPTSTTSTTTTSTTAGTTLGPITATSAGAQLIFPHLADGGGYRTSLLITNSSNIAVEAQISFLSPQGNPLNMRIGEITASQFSVNVAAGGSARLTTAGSAPAVSTGWARIAWPAGSQLNGNAVFQWYAEGRLVSEASVPAALTAGAADFFADESAGIHTGFAMVNPGTATARGTITLRSASGASAASRDFLLAPGCQEAQFLYELFPGAASGRAEIRLLEGAVAVVALRFHETSIFSTLSTGVPGASWSTLEAFFSPKGGVRARLITEIDRAAKSIDLAIYTLTSFALRDALIGARNRGIPIRIVADLGQISDPNSQIPALERLGFEIRKISGTPSGLMHNKYVIIDGALLCTGSYNWSNSAEEYNFENALFLQGSPVIGAYIADFERLWGK